MRLVIAVALTALGGCESTKQIAAINCANIARYGPEAVIQCEQGKSHMVSEIGLRNAATAAHVAAVGQSMMTYSAQRAAEPSPFNPLGTYAGERDNGGNKICIYNNLGQSSVLTVPLVSACPR